MNNHIKIRQEGYTLCLIFMCRCGIFKDLNVILVIYISEKYRYYCYVVITVYKK